MLGQLRSKIAPLELALAKPFAMLGLSPNAISLLGIPVALIAAYFIISEQFLLAAIFAAIAPFIDLVDGSVAKLTNKKTYFGNYLETMIDKYVEFILFAACVFLYPIAAVLALGFSLIESYAKPRVALVIIADNRDWPAIGEHADRLLILIAALLITAFYPIVYGYAVLEIALYLIAAMTLLGGIQRILFARGLIEEAKRKGNILPYLKKGLGHKAMK